MSLQVDYELGAVVRTLPGDSETITALAWHPSGAQLAASSRRCVMTVMDYSQILVDVSD